MVGKRKPEFDFIFATYSGLPDLEPDEQPAVAELQRRGWRCLTAVWDDPCVDWSNTTHCIVRSTWEYYRKPIEFVAWVKRVSQTCALHNPASVILANWDKRYLLELQARGVQIVPTVLVNRQSDVKAVLTTNNWHKAVLKPTVGAGTYGVKRIDLQNEQSVREAQAFLKGFEADGMLLQEFMESVTTYGERNLVFIDGKYSHAIHKQAFQHTSEKDEPPHLVEATASEIDFAVNVLRQIPSELLYARVDIAPDDQGKLRLMELELIEPSLYLSLDSKATTRFVEALEKVAFQTACRAADAGATR